MSEQTFSLQPFPSTKSLPNLKIAVNIARNGNKLAIRYILEDNLKEIAIAPPSNTPSRKHELWQDTCFEFFVGIKDSARYWEFNLSPAGHWNVYRFDRYRQGMQEETAFENLPFNVQNQADGLILVLDVDLNKIISAEEVIEVAITTVIKDKDGEITYWALTHRGAEADFHLRDSFIVELC
ncbi:UDP-N-acetylenolpyruvoylglucosamine reductase [Nostoc flagelliforme CCNUN1]|uniref:UDP-N-acetylenolpyruvoylglucosamine reductase n=1 Tax=Nostoc flagelliforme CCNUN1 TaxID=2038116 RepID=A0A2K8SLN4_9NOSO|nr:DOMON-like domain-containing protein [Nostoc flagelliforme]AUB36213.1 UDP-N-acetylenolpyruvoylglucosamine reductase [Nostoc flagelliforme CCNUN1]